MKTELKTYPGDTDRDGKLRLYKVTSSNTWYDHETPDGVIEVLEGLRESRKPVRMFYGDDESGLDWNEEHEMFGRIGRSTGSVKIPLMIVGGADGGGGILTHCIVQLMQGGKILWAHPLYHSKEFSTRENNGEHKDKLPFEVLRDGEVHARFKTLEKVNKYIAFMKGESNKF